MPPYFTPTGVIAPDALGREPAVEIVEADAHADLLRARGNGDGRREKCWNGGCGREAQRQKHLSCLYHFPNPVLEIAHG